MKNHVKKQLSFQKLKGQILPRFALAVAGPSGRSGTVEPFGLELPTTPKLCLKVAEPSDKHPKCKL